MSIEVPIGSRVSPGGAQGAQGIEGEQGIIGPQGEQGIQGERGPQGPDFLPVGSILAYGGTTAPQDYLICDGASYLREAYPELAEVLGTAYGGDANNFNVPDLRSRGPVGLGPMDGTSTHNFTLGLKHGTPTHILTTAELATHNHGNIDINHNHGVWLNAHGHGDPWHQHSLAVAWRLPPSGQNWLDCPPSISGDYWGNTIGAGTGLHNAGNFGGGTNWVSEQAANWHLRGTNNAGSGAAHNNCSPSLGVNFIIKT